MLYLTANTKVLLATHPVDFRRYAEYLVMHSTHS